MNAYEKLRPALLWELFAGICAIPHTSGHEARLRRWIADEAVKRGLKTKTDAAGNLRIDRPAAPGFEHVPPVLMQGHLDMVPQKRPGTAFDFITEPIRLKLKGKNLYADGTTLGADDGIGLAAGLSLLFDPAFACGPLALLATVQEETGLDGAREIEADMLAGDLLLNLDSEDEGVFCIGCAGGETISFRFTTEHEPLTGDAAGFRLTLRGLKGGHSGTDIDGNRGNAVSLLVDFLQKNPACRIASFTGGTVDNAIPDEAQAEFAVPQLEVETLTAAVADTLRRIREKYDVLPDCDLKLEPIAPPPRVWKEKFQQRALTAIHQLPNGVLDPGAKDGPIVTSCNLAVFRARLKEGRVVLHPRSTADAHGRVTGRCRELMEPLSPQAEIAGSYPSWQPRTDSPALKMAVEVYTDLFKTEPVCEVIHAGLECGLFKRLRPELDMISFGPTVRGAHTTSEHVETATVARFDRFLRALLLRWAEREKP